MIAINDGRNLDIAAYINGKVTLLVATLLFYSGTNYTFIIVNELDGLFMFIDMVLVMAMPI